MRIGIPGGLGHLVVSGMLSDHSRRSQPTVATRLAAVADELDSPGLSRAIRSVLVNRTGVVDALTRISAPTLVIAGDEDHAFSLVHAEELADRIPGARLEVLPRVGHLAPLEAPAEVGALLKRFLAPEGN